MLPIEQGEVTLQLLPFFGAAEQLVEPLLSLRHRAALLLTGLLGELHQPIALRAGRLGQRFAEQGFIGHEGGLLLDQLGARLGNELFHVWIAAGGPGKTKHHQDGCSSEPARPHDSQ